MNRPHPALELMATDPQAREGLVEALRREAELRNEVVVLRDAVAVLSARVTNIQDAFVRLQTALDTMGVKP